MENVKVGAFYTVSWNSWLGLLPGPGIYKKMYLLHCKSGRPWSQCKGKDLQVVRFVIDCRNTLS